MDGAKYGARCAVYTRKSTGIKPASEINSLATQRNVCRAYITSQKHRGWIKLPNRYDDGGQPGGNLDRPALAQLMEDIEQGRIDTVVVYKIDRLTRSLIDFVRLMDIFEQRNITLVSVSQAFDTSDSMGRMVLNILLTFSQFEREMIGERVRDSLRARKRYGKIHGGKCPFGYVTRDDDLIVDENEARIVRFIFDQFLKTERYISVQRAVEDKNFRSTVKQLRNGGVRGGGPISPTIVHGVLQNPIYVGEIKGHDGNYPGRHDAIIPRSTWERAQELVKSRKKAVPASKGSDHLLIGLIHDELGRSMYLDVQRKKEKVYTFYASVDAQWSRSKYIKAYRCNASKLDDLSIAALTDFLCSRKQLRSALKRVGVRGEELEALAQHASSSADYLKRAKRSELRHLIEALLVDVEVGKEQVTFTLRGFELKRFLEWKDRSPFRANKRAWPISEAAYEFAVEVNVVSAEKWQSLNIYPSSRDRRERPSKGLVNLIIMARQALRLIDADRDLSVPEMAKKLQVRPSQFSRLIRLNYLAPDILTSILDGTAPPSLTRKELLRSNIPTDWSLQRRLLGFPQPTRPKRVRDVPGLWPHKD